MNNVEDDLDKDMVLCSGALVPKESNLPPKPKVEPQDFLYHRGQYLAVCCCCCTE